MRRPRGKGSSVNAEILDRIIAHAIHLEQYKNHQVRQIVAFLNSELEPELLRQLQKHAGRTFTVGRLTAVRESVQEIVLAGYRRLGQDMTADLVGLGLAESKWNVSMLRQALPVGVSFAAPSIGAVREMIRHAPVQGRFLKEWLADLAPATLRRVNQQIMLGATAGEGVDQMVRRIVGTRANRYADGILDRSRREVAALVRTAVSGVSNNVRHGTYRKNDHVVKAVMFVATLDLRVCEACGGRDGRTYEIDEGERPPIHPGCRCTTCPVLKSWQELGLDLREAPAALRASLDGQVPETVRFPAWLARQSAAAQDRVLGQTKGQWYRAGKVDFPDFVSAQDGTRIVTLTELERAL